LRICLRLDWLQTITEETRTCLIPTNLKFQVKKIAKIQIFFRKFPTKNLKNCKKFSKIHKKNPSKLSHFSGFYEILCKKM